MACILAARTWCGVQPVWSHNLQLVTTYDYDQVAPCYSLLLQYSSALPNRLAGPPPLPPPSADKVLELNQNIGNQLPPTRPATTKARGNDKDGHREEKFNIKAKREQMENIKRTIKDKLIALNNKSRSIETLLEDDCPPGVKSALSSYRAQSLLHSSLRPPPVPLSGDRETSTRCPDPQPAVPLVDACTLVLPNPSTIRDPLPEQGREPGPADRHQPDPRLEPEGERERERRRLSERERGWEGERPSKSIRRVEFCPPQIRESRHFHKPNNTTIDIATVTSNPPTEKENAQAKADVCSKSTKAAGSRDSGAPGSVAILLKQKSMRV